MVKVASMRANIALLVVVGIALFVTSCGGTSQLQNDVTLSYTLPLIPITFSIDTNGHISVSASVNIVTELGEISVSTGAQASPFSVPNNSLLVVIRHQENGNLVDSGYQIDTGGQGSIDVQGNINEVNVGWNGNSNSVFIDASNGNITSIVLQGTASTDTTPIAPVNQTSLDTPTPTFQCPSESDVSNWMNVDVSRVDTSTDACAFTAGNNGQTLSRVICTTQDGGATIEYTPTSETNTLVVKACDGNTLPDIWGFTIRFVNNYPSGEYGADVCTIAKKAPQYLPSGWTVQANC